MAGILWRNIKVFLSRCSEVVINIDKMNQALELLLKEAATGGLLYEKVS